jgi:hypothetical protein
MIYRLKITLLGIKPPIWRQVEVPADTNLYLLHNIIQGAMGWTNSHLHQFKHGGLYYGIALQGMEDHYNEDERKVKLSKLMRKAKDKLKYEYDFGDGWEHELLLEAIVAPDPQAQYPRLLAGARACPPEDCGGVWGYAEMVEAMKNPEHPQHDEFLEWLEEDGFDPDDVDLLAQQAEMAAMFKMGKKNKGREFEDPYF